MSPARTFKVEDEGDEYDVALFEDGHQVGSALFPDDGHGAAFALALAIGQAWEGVAV